MSKSNELDKTIYKLQTEHEKLKERVAVLEDKLKVKARTNNPKNKRKFQAMFVETCCADDAEPSIKLYEPASRDEIRALRARLEPLIEKTYSNPEVAGQLFVFDLETDVLKLHETPSELV